MTGIAPFEPAYHLLIVRHSMAILALWNNTVFIRMTEYTLKTGVLGYTTFKSTLDVSMTGAAMNILYFRTICQGERLVDLMTSYAVCKLLPGHMRFMAVKTVRLVTMLVVTEGTVNLCMFGRMSINLLYNFRVTGVAGSFNFTCKNNIQWLMWILVTAQAIIQ